MAVTKVLAIVLAGGEGNRLMPLTADRAKPAVPFAGGYRLIDFALSNLVNSGYRQIVVLTQYKSHSLDRRISETWRMSTQLGNYIASVPAQQRFGKSWFLGSANAIYQSLNLIHDAQPDIVVVGADHVYRMDFSQMVEQHIASGKAVTVAGVRQPLELAPSFGVIETDPEDPTKIAAFVEKPAQTQGLAEDPEQFLASMGNYVFDTDALLDALRHDAEKLDTKHDMGGDIIPYLVERGEAGVYDFNHNDIPGATERDRYYWRDVGTIDSYYDAQMDLYLAAAGFQSVQLGMAHLHQAINFAAGKVGPRKHDGGRRRGFDRGQWRGDIRWQRLRQRAGARCLRGRRRDCHRFGADGQGLYWSWCCGTQSDSGQKCPHSGWC